MRNDFNYLCHVSVEEMLLIIVVFLCFSCKIEHTKNFNVFLELLTTVCCTLKFRELRVVPRAIADWLIDIKYLSCYMNVPCRCKFVCHRKKYNQCDDSPIWMGGLKGDDQLSPDIIHGLF